MIIDAHCHVYPDKIAEKAAQATGNFYSLKMNFDGKVSTLLSVGEKAGIDKYIIQSVATTPVQVRSINEFIHKTVEQFPDKLYGLGTLHPESADIEGDLERLTQLGLRGVKLHPDIQKFKIDDPRCMKIYGLCEEKHLPILIHTGDNRYDYSNPNRLIPVLDKYTRLTVIGAHFGGWSIWEDATEQLYGKEGFFVDCSSSFYMLSDEQIVTIIRKYGSERVLFGTDYPMWRPEVEIERLRSLSLTAMEKENIFRKSAINAYNL